MKKNERRKHARKYYEDSALIHLNTKSGSVEKVGKVENISFGGICLKNLKDAGLESSGSVIEGDSAAVYFRSTPISIFGTVARSEAGGRIIVKVRQSTDDTLWENITS